MARAGRYVWQCKAEEGLPAVAVYACGTRCRQQRELINCDARGPWCARPRQSWEQEPGSTMDGYMTRPAERVRVRRGARVGGRRSSPLFP